MLISPPASPTRPSSSASTSRERRDAPFRRQSEPSVVRKEGRPSSGAYTRGIGQMGKQVSAARAIRPDRCKSPKLSPSRPTKGTPSPARARQLRQTPGSPSPSPVDDATPRASRFQRFDEPASTIASIPLRLQTQVPSFGPPSILTPRASPIALPVALRAEVPALRRAASSSSHHIQRNSSQTRPSSARRSMTSTGKSPRRRIAPELPPDIENLDSSSFFTKIHLSRAEEQLRDLLDAADQNPTSCNLAVSKPPSIVTSPFCLPSPPIDELVKLPGCETELESERAREFRLFTEQLAKAQAESDRKLEIFNREMEEWANSGAQPSMLVSQEEAKRKALKEMERKNIELRVASGCPSRLISSRSSPVQEEAQLLPSPTSSPVRPLPSVLQNKKRTHSTSTSPTALARTSSLQSSQASSYRTLSIAGSSQSSIAGYSSRPSPNVPNSLSAHNPSEVMRSVTCPLPKLPSPAIADVCRPPLAQPKPISPKHEHLRRHLARSAIATSTSSTRSSSSSSNPNLNKAPSKPVRTASTRSTFVRPADRPFDLEWSLAKEREIASRDGARRYVSLQELGIGQPFEDEDEDEDEDEEEEVAAAAEEEERAGKKGRGMGWMRWFSGSGVGSKE